MDIERITWKTFLVMENKVKSIDEKLGFVVDFVTFDNRKITFSDLVAEYLENDTLEYPLCSYAKYKNKFFNNILIN